MWRPLKVLRVVVLTGAAAGVGAGGGTGLGGWGRVLEAAWEERVSLAEGGEGSSGTIWATEGFFLLEGGTRGGGRDMGTGSPSRARYTRYMAWESENNNRFKKSQLAAGQAATRRSSR